MFDPTTLLGLHTWLSLIALAAGLLMILRMIGGRLDRGITALFLVTALLTSLTGFLFPAGKILPSHIVGALSLVVIWLAIIALYRFGNAGRWQRVFIICAVAAVYLDAFVAVAQSFLKVPSLHALAPTGSEPAFAIAQAITLLTFVWAGYMAIRRLGQSYM